jgi:hypothetical protein
VEEAGLIGGADEVLEIRRIILWASDWLDVNYRSILYGMKAAMRYDQLLLSFPCCLPEPAASSRSILESLGESINPMSASAQKVTFSCLSRIMRKSWSACRAKRVMLLK